jgi:hypothetical protein
MEGLGFTTLLFVESRGALRLGFFERALELLLEKIEHHATI